MSETFGPYLGDYRRWLWNQLQAGVNIYDATQHAPDWAKEVVDTAFARKDRIEQQLSIVTGPGPDARRNIQEVK